MVTGLDVAVFVDPDAGAGSGAHIAYHARDAGRPLVAGGQLPLAAVRGIEKAMAAKARRTPAQRKIGSHLLDAAEDPAILQGLDTDDASRVLVDVTAEVSPALLERIAALGGRVVDSVPRYRAIRARLPVEVLEALAADDAVKRIEPADIAVSNAEEAGPGDPKDNGGEPVGGGSIQLPAEPSPSSVIRSRSGALLVPVGQSIRQGLRVPAIRHPGDDAAAPGSGTNAAPAHAIAKENTSEGDVAHDTPAARERFGVDGTGIGIGVLSDGIRTLADRQATGDLPSRVTVLSGQEGEGDEGTAMLEVVHDLAPGADLYFATASGGQARFATNIEALCESGANVVMDDVLYLTEGAFQDDTVARAINDITANGCFHFSPAGNSGNLDAGTAGVWEGDFASAESEPPPGVEGVVHDFGGAGSNVIEELGLALQLKWADPLGAATNDYDLYLFDGTLTELRASSTNGQTGSADPYESIRSGARVGDRLVVVKASGEHRYLRLNALRGRLEHVTDGQIFGHLGAKSAITAAAVDARRAGGADGVFDGSEQVEAFSSDGPRRIFFEPDGAPLTPGDFGSAGGELVAKPDIAAADGVTTATPGFRDFHGTSAAVAHAAAIAALALQAAGGARRVTPDALRAALADEALDIAPEGADRNAGAGIVMAPAAVAALDSADEHHAPTVAVGIGDRTLLGLASATVDLSVHFDDADGDELAYSVLPSDAGIAGAGVEASTLTLSPTGRGTATITVRASDPGGLSVLETFTVTVDREWGTTDYDTDDDGLIEIATLEQLDALRHDLDGDGVEDVLAAQPLYFAAFPDAVRDLGCANGCTGYEVMSDLDFDKPSSYASGRVDRGWSRSESGEGWAPIGRSAAGESGLIRPDDCFAADFDGNGRAIANLFIDRRDRDNVGLFGGLWEGRGDGIEDRSIRDLRLVNADVNGRYYVGGLAGGLRNCHESGCARRHLDGVSVTGRVAGLDSVGGLAGYANLRIVRSHAAVRVSGRTDVGGLVGNGHRLAKIGASYATGTVRGTLATGGLAGSFASEIAGSYATGPVSGVEDVGGLIGYAWDLVEVWASFSTGPVAGERRVGGLIGRMRFAAPIFASYWDVETSGILIGVGSDDADHNGRIDGAERTSDGVSGKTTAELTGPRGYRGIYANWRVGAELRIGESPPRRASSGMDGYDPWHFGTEEQYPALKADYDMDGVRTWEEFGRQLRERPVLAVIASDGLARLTWTRPPAHWPGSNGIRFNVYRNGELLAGEVAATMYDDRPPATTWAATHHEYQVAAEVDGGEPVRSAIVAVGNRAPATPPVADRAARVGKQFRYAFPSGGDPDGHAVVYRASDMPTWLAFDAPARTFSGTPDEGDAASADIRVTALDAGTPRLSRVATFRLTVNPSAADNRAPEVKGAIAELTVATGETETVNVEAVFEDPDGDALSYAARVGDTDVATARPSDEGLVVEAVGAGRTTVTSIASDGDLTAELEFEVEVVNAAPYAAEPISETTLVTPGAPWVFDAAGHFADRDGDALSYAAESSDPDVVSVEVRDSTVAATPTGGGTATVTVSAADRAGSNSTARQTVQVAVRVDYDRDDDGLIEVGDLGQLDAVRLDTNGDGIVGSDGSPRFPTPAIGKVYDAAFPHRLYGMGCWGGCNGYELTADLDFDTNGNGIADAGDRFWNDGLGWEPIGGLTVHFGPLVAFYTADTFRAVFEGNGHAISGLFIDRSESAVGALAAFRMGLFATIGKEGAVRNVRVIGATVVGGQWVGAIAGSSAGHLSGVVSTGTVKGRNLVGGVVGIASGAGVSNARAHVRVTGETNEVGGLVGVNNATITGSYATGPAAGGWEVGGLVGNNSGVISASYATGTAAGDVRAGGLVGWNFGRIVASYTTGTVAGERNGGVAARVQGTGAEVAASYSERHAADGIAVGYPASRVGSRTTADLLRPSGYDGIYQDWNVDLDGDGEPDDPWTFMAGRYPALKTDADGDGVATWQEFGPQWAPSGVAVKTGGTDTDAMVVTWDVPLDAGEGITGYELQRKASDALFADVDPPHVGTKTRYADTAPPKDTAYTYRVRAVTALGTTHWSQPASTAPGPPRLGAEEGAGQATLTWVPPDNTGTSAVTGYQYQQTADGGETWDPVWTDVPDNDALARSFTVRGLFAGASYGFEVRAVNASGPGAGSARAIVTLRSLGPPRNLSAAAGDGRVTLRWSPPANAGAFAITGYEFRYSVDDGATWVPDWTDLPGGAVEGHVVEGLANATSYTFEVRAVEAHGPGPAARVEVRTPPAVIAAIPDLVLPALGDGENLHLARFFAVAPGGRPTYTAVSGDPALLRVRVDGDVLVVTPNDVGEEGETTVTVRAVDGEGRPIEIVFKVAVEPLRTWWHRWGLDAMAEGLTD